MYNAKVQREYYLKNKKEIDLYQKEYRGSHKKESASYKQAWYLKNKSRQLERQKLRRNNRTPAEILLEQTYQKDWKAANSTHKALYDKKYRSEHKEEARISSVRRYKTNIQFRLGKRLRERFRIALKNGHCVGSVIRDMGCSIPELKMYLEGQFKDGMTWDNWSMTGWHIDHKIPLAFFDLTDREQFLKAAHYSNLQPLWAKENLVKNKSFKQHEIQSKI